LLDPVPRRGIALRSVVAATGVAAAFAGMVLMWPIGLVGYYASFEKRNPVGFRELSCACSRVLSLLFRMAGAKVEPELARLLDECRR